MWKSRHRRDVVAVTASVRWNLTHWLMSTQVESRAAQLGEEDSTGDPARVVLEAVLLYAKTYATLARDGAVGDARSATQRRK